MDSSKLKGEATMDFSKIKTISIKNKKMKVHIKDFARPFNQKNISISEFQRFYDSLPKTDGDARNLREIALSIHSAVRKKKPVLAMLGAHVVKCGLSLILIDLIKEGYISALAMNGAVAIHDFEIALFGKTSEDVLSLLKKGLFGMTRETASEMNSAIEEGAKKGLGFGESIGKKIESLKAPNRKASLLFNAYTLSIPATVHVALGTDIIHQHPSVDGSSIGITSMRDFKKITEVVSKLNNGGVVLNFGSAVIMPEVFLKALNLARNIKGKIENFTTCNFDRVQHYRPTVNLVERPVHNGGRGFTLIGSHEILIPLLSLSLKVEKWRNTK